MSALRPVGILELVVHQNVGHYHFDLIGSKEPPRASVSPIPKAKTRFPNADEMTISNRISCFDG